MNRQLVFPDGVDAAGFLRFFWQRRPLLMPAALPGFTSPLAPEELAGLACEDGVESRLVRQLRTGPTPWKVEYGPFRRSRFRKLPESHWTLLVQDVDKYVPAVARILDSFRFLPDWRIDDVMVSHAADQGSVGPHWDEYDVFLIQGHGRRRWQIAKERPAPDNVLPGVDLRIMARFEPDTEWIVEPGDVLYLPPGVPHWGVALGDCMTYSVGFRAPSLREIASSWFETVLETVPEAHYRDGELRPPAHSAAIAPDAMSRALELIDALTERSDDAKRRWFGRFVTEPKPNLLVEPRDAPLSPSEFRRRLEEVGAVHRHPFSRFAHFGGEDGSDWLFVAGEDFRIDSRQRAFAQVLCQWRELHFGFVAEWIDCADCLDLMTRLCNAGHLAFPDDD
jgi:50S ribosomal protein L16 3-hydroxylase